MRLHRRGKGITIINFAWCPVCASLVDSFGALHIGDRLILGSCGVGHRWILQL
jgi:hypothetical protein